MPDQRTGVADSIAPTRSHQLGRTASIAMAFAEIGIHRLSGTDGDGARRRLMDL